MKFILTPMVTIVFLLVQMAFCKNRRMSYIFILPVTIIIVGLVYQFATLHMLQFSGLYPFFIVSGCLLLFGYIKRLENRKKEMEHMKSQDL